MKLQRVVDTGVHRDMTNEPHANTRRQARTEGRLRAGVRGHGDSDPISLVTWDDGCSEDQMTAPVMLRIAQVQVLRS